MPKNIFRQTKYDAIIVGGGHNGLTSAAYLAHAGLSVLVLERRQQVGGAAVSESIFPGINANLSAYAYLLSLFPEKIMRDLNLNIATRRRSVASFTPVMKAGKMRSLLVSNVSARETEDSFRRFTGTDHEFDAFKHFYHLAAVVANRVWPTLTEPLPTRKALQQRFDTVEARQAWNMVFEQPLGITIERLFSDDAVRGLVFTDAKIGVLTYPHDPSLLQNRTFLYHVIGNNSGEWRVPLGGMGAVTAELYRAARTAGAEISTGAQVDALHLSDVDSRQHTVAFTVNDQQYQLDAQYILINATPTELGRLVTGYIDETQRPNGSVFKINMLLNRLPKLNGDSIYSSEQAFTGTFHLDEGYMAMQQSYDAAVQGHIPTNIPGEMYCHSLTDNSILDSSLHNCQTLTLFGLDVPYRLFATNHDQVKQVVLNRYLDEINRHLTEPLEACFVLDQYGAPCLDAKSPVDLERELTMHGGNIFHTDLSWPFATPEMEAEETSTWGVETAFHNVFLCGSGAMRGGCVSGIPGHNAAMKIFEVIAQRKGK